jgi:hypothetical protein
MWIPTKRHTVATIIGPDQALSARPTSSLNVSITRQCTMPRWRAETGVVEQEKRHLEQRGAQLQKLPSLEHGSGATARPSARGGQ